MKTISTKSPPTRSLAKYTMLSNVHLLIYGTIILVILIFMFFVVLTNILVFLLFLPITNMCSLSNNNPLECVFSYVWAPTLIQSINGSLLCNV
ncbi:hypothetical protein CR513_12806, partial [Mucuna pruriens]